MTDRERDLLGIDELKYDANGLIPAVVQQHDTGEVLMVAYMNRESLRRDARDRHDLVLEPQPPEVLDEGRELGQHAGRLEVRYDCDADCLLVLVDQTARAPATPGSARASTARCIRPDAPSSRRRDSRRSEYS